MYIIGNLIYLRTYGMKQEILIYLVQRVINILSKLTSISYFEWECSIRYEQ